MSKKLVISLSVLLITAAVLMELLIKDSNTLLDIELLEFFIGVLFGVGITLPLQLFIKKK